MTLLHTRTTGRGPRTVVLLGALGSSIDMWTGVQDRLSPDTRVISIDHRGHGGSDMPDAAAHTSPVTITDLAADVVETLDLLDLTDPASIDLVGLSIGGAVAQHLAGTPGTANRIRSLCLMCTAPAFGSPEDWTAKATGVRAGGTATLRELAEGTVQRWLTPGHLAERPATGLAITEMIARTSPEGYAQCCEALSTFSGDHLLAGIRCPTLTVAGDTDPTCPPATLRAMSDAIAANGHGATVRHEVVAPGAHLLPVQQPDAVTGLLAGHVGL